MSPLRDRNRKTLAAALAGVAAMVALSFASVPLYRKICQVTGWGGTTRIVESNPYAGRQDGRMFTVRFDSSVAPGLPWSFRPEALEVRVRAGQDGFISYLAENRGTAPVTGTAVYNVTPLEAGKYFYKTQCFCFGEQRLNPGEAVHMPVVFFIDPAIENDRDLRDVNAITLSYTFYETDTPALEKAVENFLETADNP